MQVLRNPDERVMTILGPQPVYLNLNYRLMKYCVQVEVEEGILILNGLTRAVVLLKEEEFDELYNMGAYEILYRMYFLVPDDFDDYTVINSTKDKLRTKIDDLYLNHPSSFTILSTTLCNARCFYCYELEEPKIKHHHMTAETAKKVANYILNYADRSQTISLHWFGGEPLFNAKAINIIIDKLIENNVSFTTNFTTNGYLFDKLVLDKAINKWNTISAQITIDGTEEVYNKTKNYIYAKGPSPFQKVMNNIAGLLNAGIEVNVRMNIDNYNGENLCELIEYLHERFGNHPKLCIYGWPIFEDDVFKRTPEEHKSVFEWIEKIEQLLEKYGYYHAHDLKGYLEPYQCMADCGNTVTISPDGDLGTCEHFVDSHFFSNVNNPEVIDKANLDIWREYNGPFDICDDCPIMGDCILPKYCREMGNCDEEYKKWRIKKVEKSLLKFYYNIKGKPIKKLDDNIWN